MNPALTRLAQAAIVLALIGSVVVQAMILPAIYRDLHDAPPFARATFVTLLGLGILGLQIFAVCTTRLLSQVSARTVLCTTSFREVDVIAWSLVGVALSLAGIAFLLAPGGVAPGIVGLIGGAALVVATMALLTRVLKGLLRQAIAQETEVVALRGELGEVI